jgi:starch synthase (maltosyl-transferring)
MDSAQIPPRVAIPIPATGRHRPVITAIRPSSPGPWPPKAAVGDRVVVEADVVINGPDLVACDVAYTHEADEGWTIVAMHDIGNDRFGGEIPINALGLYRFVVRARPDAFETWRRDLRLRLDANQDVSTDLLIGATILWDAAARATGADRRLLASAAEHLGAGTGLDGPLDSSLARIAPAPPRGPTAAGGAGPTMRSLLFSGELGRLVARHPDPTAAVVSEIQRLFADPERARFSAWYELFPRSASPDPGRPGTLADVERLLGYVARLGFDVVYLPPIHPIGRTNRKGRDGRPVAGPGDPGSPWAIGAAEGGHTAVHPELGTLEDLRSLVEAAGRLGIDVALDLAFQASPDHPWVAEHPEWFRRDPDGKIRCAENPPKRYEDIYPLDFDSPNWPGLWEELADVARFWVDQGIRVFRVDNPHTKPFRFWEWFIATMKADHPELIFLSEAFTRPKVMYELARLGFTQSYTYFAWRNEKWELEDYLKELTTTEVADFFRPNLWPNTPDILTERLQTGGTAAFVVRLVLAATLGASYGIYGPAFELQEHLARERGSEEYAHSEKYEIRHWDLSRRDSLAGLIGRVNEVRRSHPALRHDRNLRFHRIENDQVIAYSKRAIDPDDPDTIVVIANLDPLHTQSGWVELDTAALGIDPTERYVMHDLLTDARYEWGPSRNFVMLDPSGLPVHLFSLERGEVKERGGR